MPFPDKQGPADGERRTVPRHLRDGEHEGIATTSVAGRRAEDAAPARGWILWLVLSALVAVCVWWWLRD